MLNSDFGLFAYDPRMINVTFGGDKVHGFSAQTRIFLKRGLYGVAEAKIHLQATSPWVPRLKKALGKSDILDVAYQCEIEEYAESFAFRAEMYVDGYEVDVNNEVPIFVFHLRTKGDYSNGY